MHRPQHAFSLTLLLASATITAPAAESIRYTLTPLPDEGVTEVVFAWSTRGRTESIAQILPATGRINDVQGMLVGTKIDGADAIQTKGTWHITHDRGATIRMTYRIKPPRRGMDWDGTEYPVTNYRFFHGLGKTFLITPQAGGGMPSRYECAIRWKLPDKWQAVCSLGPGPSVGSIIDPADLRNAIFYAGKIDVQTKVTDGREVTVAMPDRFKFSIKRFLKVASEIIGHQCEFVNEKNFPPFVITIVPVGEPIKAGEARLSGSGLYNSFALWMAPESRLNDGVENLFAHELFHQWNGRILKAEMPDKLCYWFVEGLTDYYAQRILFESGYWTPRKYAKWINRHIRDYANNPANRATNAEIADQYWAQRNTVGEAPYQRGQLLGMRWHKIAREKGKRAGIDAWFFTLLDKARKNPKFEFTNDSLRSSGVATFGKWFGEEFDKYVFAAEIVDVPRDALEPKLEGSSTYIYEFDAGFDVEKSRAASRIIDLDPKSRAARAGLRENDDAVGWLLQGDPDKEVVIRVRRAGQTQDIRYMPRGDRKRLIQFEPRKK